MRLSPGFRSLFKNPTAEISSAEYASLTVWRTIVRCFSPVHEIFLIKLKTRRTGSWCLATGLNELRLSSPLNFHFGSDYISSLFPSKRVQGASMVSFDFYRKFSVLHDPQNIKASLKSSTACSLRIAALLNYVFISTKCSTGFVLSNFKSIANMVELHFF